MRMYNKLIWEDDFDGSELDLSKWSFRTGNWQVAPDGTPVVPGWGNRELQYYTGNGENVSFGGSCLSLIARRENSPEQFGQTYGYTSARIDTRDKFSFTYGRIEFRASCPLGTGLWPAVWMLPEGEEYGPWAASGELDLLEAKGRLSDRVFGTIHYGGAYPLNTHQEYTATLPAGTGIDSFHTYEVIWEPGRISWLVDGRVYAAATEWRSRTPGIEPPAPFDKPFYLLVNLAVGGSFDEQAMGRVTTDLPAEFQLDYIRIFQ